MAPLQVDLWNTVRYDLKHRRFWLHPGQWRTWVCLRPPDHCMIDVHESTEVTEGISQKGVRLCAPLRGLRAACATESSMRTGELDQSSLPMVSLRDRDRMYASGIQFPLSMLHHVADWRAA